MSNYFADRIETIIQKGNRNGIRRNGQRNGNGNGNGNRKRQLETLMERHIKSLNENQKRCFPFKYGGERWPGWQDCLCPDNQTKITVDVPRGFPGPWLWAGPDWPSKVLDTPDKRISACQRAMRWRGMSVWDKIKEATNPNTEVGREVAIYKPVLKNVQEVLGPASILFPPLALVEAAALTGEKGVDAVFKFIQEL